MDTAAVGSLGVLADNGRLVPGAARLRLQESRRLGHGRGCKAEGRNATISQPISDKDMPGNHNLVPTKSDRVEADALRAVVTPFCDAASKPRVVHLKIRPLAVLTV